MDGRRIWLAPREASASQARAELYRQLALQGQPGPLPLAVRDLCSLFLDWTQANRSPATLQWYHRHLTPFVTRHGGWSAAEIQPLHVSQWLVDHQAHWNETTRCGAATAVKRVFAWAYQQGHLPSNSLQHLERPTPKRREGLPAEAELLEVLELWPPDDPFRAFLDLLLETGARPGELTRMTCADLRPELACAVLAQHKTGHATRRPRVVYLTAAALARLQALAARWPSGPLLRNAAGEPWTRHAISCRFKRQRQAGRIEPGVCAQLLRHGFATRALERGVPIATVAELLGHTSTTMVSRHYSHLSDRREHLKAAVEQATSTQTTSP